jgi:hypothetical protein
MTSEAKQTMGQPAADPRAAEVHRLLHRYLVEVVEAWSLCPWAYNARTRGEVHVEIQWGTTGDLDAICALARRGLAAPGARVVMLVFPELAGGVRTIEALRDGVALRVAEAGVAAFGPHGAFDLSSPAKLVPLLRRSPDPMLQLVPFTLLDELRQQLQPSEPPARNAQALALAGHGAPPPPSMIDGIARRNHAVIAPDGAAQLQRTLADLARDRAISYPRAGIRIAGA